MALFSITKKLDWTLLCRRGESYLGLVGKFCHTLHIVPTLRLQIFICFDLQNSLHWINSEEDAKVCLEEFFASKERKFFEQRIMDQPTELQKLLERNDNYIIDQRSCFMFKTCIVISLKYRTNNLADQYNRLYRSRLELTIYLNKLQRTENSALGIITGCIMQIHLQEIYNKTLSDAKDKLLP